jgi:hypothetical protein
VLKLDAEAGVAAGERVLKLGVVGSGRGDETEKAEEIRTGKDAATKYQT